MNPEHLGLKPGKGKYIMTWTTWNGSPLSVGPIPSDRLNNFRDIDKWSSLSPCLSNKRMLVIRDLGLYLCSQDG